MLEALTAGVVQAALAMALSTDVVLVPTWCPWQATDVACHLAPDGSDDMRLVVADGCMEVYGADGAVWYSPPAMHVTCTFAQDLDDDGVQEVVALVWRRGSYGSSHPFWVEPDHDLGQHVYVMWWDGQALQQRWTSSALHAQVAAADMDDAGTLTLTTTKGDKTRWYWDGWGFTLLEEGEQPPTGNRS